MSKLATVISVRGRKLDELLVNPDFVYVGRAVGRNWWPASKWGNPFPYPRFRDAVDQFRYRLALAISGEILDSTWHAEEFRVMAVSLPELQGKTLGCWCGHWEPGQPEIACHAVVLAKAVNALTLQGAR